jgi:uncharacterized protein YrrD
MPWKEDTMIRSAKEMKKFEVVATDGQIGSVDDFYFDDERWAIRYLVVDTGRLLSGRRVLISPMSVSRTEWSEQQLLLSISRERVNNSPGIDTHQPVSRRHERDYLDYYGYPYYWGHAGLWGAHATPMLPTPEQIARQRARSAAAERKAADQGDTHLRSASEVSGYVIHALDGDLGHVTDVLFDDVSWAARYLVVDTSNWWFGKHVLVAPEWVTDISWSERSVSINVTRQRLKSAPLYDRAEHVDRQWEAAYYRHLQQPGYWLTDDEARAITAAQSYLRDEPDRHDVSVERRSRPR